MIKSFLVLFFKKELLSYSGRQWIEAHPTAAEA
jgi:hypothetical protein